METGVRSGVKITRVKITLSENYCVDIWFILFVSFTAFCDSTMHNESRLQINTNKVKACLR